MKQKAANWFRVGFSLNARRENAANVDRLITSWMTFNCTTLSASFPIRFAGTWRQYSKKAIPQLARITIHSGLSLKRRCPYQAVFIKAFDRIKSPTDFKMLLRINRWTCAALA